MFISGARCDVCGTIVFWEGKLDKNTMSRKLKKDGWKIIRKSGQTLEQTYCPAHASRRNNETKKAGNRGRHSRTD